MIKAIILVGIGGALGSILRFLTSAFLNKYFSYAFPLGTFLANIIGCFLIGILLGLFERQLWMTADLRFLLVVGFCGGYTTFSTFAFENIHLLQSHHTLAAFAYIAVSVGTGLLATGFGLFLVK